MTRLNDLTLTWPISTRECTFAGCRVDVMKKKLDGTLLM
jgi:hypothetical protein